MQVKHILSGKGREIISSSFAFDATCPKPPIFAWLTYHWRCDRTWRGRSLVADEPNAMSWRAVRQSVMALVCPVRGLFHDASLPPA